MLWIGIPLSLTLQGAALRSFTISGGQVTEAGTTVLREFKKLTTIEWIDPLYGDDRSKTPMEDRASLLASLERIKMLRIQSREGRPFSDSDYPAITGMKALRNLFLHNEGSQFARKDKGTVVALSHSSLKKLTARKTLRSLTLTSIPAHRRDTSD